MINTVTLVGRLTRDPEIQKIVSTGTTIGRFSIANSQYIKGEEKTSFINCVTFNRTAENVYNHVHKGDLVGVVGRIQTSQYTAKDGTKRVSTDVLVNEIQFLETRRQEQPVAAVPVEAPQTDDYGNMGLNINPDDLPF